MRKVNIFGIGQIYTMDELIAENSLNGIPLVYCTSTACMSVTSDMLSWVAQSDVNNIAFVSKNKPDYNNVIIVLGCQVTHLAILNDIRTAERLHEENPGAKVYMGGCLAQRFDIELPDFINRLDVTFSPYKEIIPYDMKLIHWEKPFWVKDWSDSDGEFEDGHLFRNYYPLKIGAGCDFNCKYCTIKGTRGVGYETDAYLQVLEFLHNSDVVLISDRPTDRQIKDWVALAIRYNKSISIRNVEPHITCACENELIELSAKGLLKIYHCPVQHSSADVLKEMNRSPEQTFKAIEIMQKLRANGTKVATNIIIDYTVDNNGQQEKAPNPTLQWLNDNFDYWSWNPYFDGKFIRSKAEKDFEYYLSDGRDIREILGE